MDDLPQDIKETLTQLDESVSKLETALDPLFKTKLADVTEGLSPQDNAKLNILYAYAINTLFYSKKWIEIEIASQILLVYLKCN